MSSEPGPRSQERWAHLRFGIVGALLAAPPAAGELRRALETLAAREWRHPISGRALRFGLSTIERWYYQARGEQRDPVGVLRRKLRKDCGQQTALSAKLAALLLAQYQAHKSWSYQLHADNLAALVAQDPALGLMPSYATVRRFMKARGWFKRRRLAQGARAGVIQALDRLEQREVRSFETEYVNGLWHLDFHHGSRKVLTPAGQWLTPLLLAILDDHSRLVCHAQWYLAESAENLVHGLCQAFQKRGLPRALLSDNGAAMIAEETEQGLRRLSILHPTTLPYSPHQNGKQEVLWAQVEGRLLAMLEGCTELTLAFLNQATQAWLELEYNRSQHAETGQPPLQRWLEAKQVGRPCPTSEALRLAFLAEVVRSQRRSDGTLTLKGIRFEIASSYRHLIRLWIRYAHWDLSQVYLADAKSGAVLARIYPLDKAKNAAAGRRRIAPEPAPLSQRAERKAAGIAPLLHRLLAEYAATGVPPAYLPKDETQHRREEEP